MFFLPVKAGTHADHAVESRWCGKRFEPVSQKLIVLKNVVNIGHSKLMFFVQQTRLYSCLLQRL
jgi:hypothetical protein